MKATRILVSCFCLNINTEPEHVIAYGTQKGRIFLNNGSSGASPISLTSSIFTFAYADGENQLLWTNSSGNLYGGILSTSALLTHVKEIAPNRKLYNWI